MDVLKAQLARIQQQLSGLSASQKMLTGSLVAIMVLTTAYWARYASTAEMVPLLNQSLSAEDLTRIHAKLTAEHVPSELSGDRILVPAEARYGAMGVLTRDRLMPRDTSNSFDEMIKTVNPFSMSSQTDQIFKQYLTRELEKVICSIPGVETAKVFIDTTSVRHV